MHLTRGGGGGFSLNFCIIGIVGQIILCCGRLFWTLWDVEQQPCLYTLDACSPAPSTLLVTTHSVCRYCQMPPGREWKVGDKYKCLWLRTAAVSWRHWGRREKEMCEVCISTEQTRIGSPTGRICKWGSGVEFFFFFLEFFFIEV